MATTVKRWGIRAIAVGGALAMTVIGPAARADDSTSSFVYGPDSRNWYWQDQVEQTIAAGPVAQPVTMGNPQAPDTLPVAAQNGEMDKVSAIAFDLLQRDIEAGATISSFVVTIAESAGDPGDPTQPDLQPTFNSEGKLVQACQITGVWSTGDGAELWERRPSFDESGCIVGRRSTSGDTAAWTFDLTAVAALWAQDPISNHGVMLVPLIEQGAAPPDATWQINLKIPSRDDGETPDDEYEQTRDRVTVDVVFTSAAPESTSGFPATPSFSGGGSGFGGGGSVSGDSGNLFGGGPAPSGGSAPSDRATSTRRPTPTLPQVPWYVWILIPAGLFAIATVRAVVLEPVTAGKPGGVIAAIRAKNTELRGVAPRPTGIAASRREAPLAALLSLGALGKRGWEALTAWTARARRRFRRP